MDVTNLNLFFKRLSEDGAMRDAFVAFAATYDVDLSELADADLDEVAGGGGTIIVIDPSLRGGRTP